MPENTAFEDSIALELLDADLYRSTKAIGHPLGSGIYRGAVLAQALSAAVKTVDVALNVHSLHANFINP